MAISYPEYAHLEKPLPPLPHDEERQFLINRYSNELPKPAYSAFSPARKYLVLSIVTAAGFLGPTSGAIYLPALQTFQDAFNTSATTINASITVFMIFFAIAPLFWAAGSDYGGRKTIYLVSLAIFITSNILLASVPAHVPSLFVLRIFQAIGSCGVLSVGAGSVADLFEPRQRASALSIFLLGPQAGPIIGPVIGGALAGPGTWRWVFGLLAILGATVYLAVLFLLPETLRCLVGNGEVYASKPWIVRPRLLQRPLVDPETYPRPPKLQPKVLLKLLVHPPILIVSVNGMNLFTAFYAMFVTFPYALPDRYGYSNAQVGYAFLVPGFAMIAGSVAAGFMSDWLRSRKERKIGQSKLSPEDRIKQQIPGLVLSAVGILMYGWFVEKGIHSAAVLFASALAGLAMTFVFITSTSFQTECFPTYAASLVALAGLIRNPAAGVAAVVTNELVKKMGYGWCFTGLALLNLLGVPGVLFIMGRKFELNLGKPK